MKISKIIFALAIIIAGASSVIAQSKIKFNSGLYLTANDFQQQKLTYEIDCSNASDKIKVNNFLGSSTGYVLAKGEKHSFDKKNVYGYRDCKNKAFRFYNGNEYQIIDTAGFYMYYQYMPEEINKGKAPVKKDEYFFSKNADGNLELLTMDNLKKAFPYNNNFHYALDANFKADKDLLVYDTFQKNYKVKYLFSQSLNK